MVQYANALCKPAAGGGPGLLAKDVGIIAPYRKQCVGVMMDEQCTTYKLGLNSAQCFVQYYLYSVLGMNSALAL